MLWYVNSIDEQTCRKRYYEFVLSFWYYIPKNMISMTALVSACLNEQKMLTEEHKCMFFRLKTVFNNKKTLTIDILIILLDRTRKLFAKLSVDTDKKCYQKENGRMGDLCRLLPYKIPSASTQTQLFPPTERERAENADIHFFLISLSN